MKRTTGVFEGFSCGLFLALALFMGTAAAHAASEDVGVVGITAPANPVPYDPTTVTITVRNFTSESIYSGNFEVRYRVDSGPWVTERKFVGTISANSELPITFTRKADLSAYGTHSITAETVLNSDDDFSNDSFTLSDLATELTSSSAQVSLPYFENFENGEGDWTALIYDDSDTIFELGTPSKTYIDGAVSGINAWATGLIGNYSPGTRTQVISPLVDLRSTFAARVSLWVAWESVNGNEDHGARLEKSADDGASWEIVDAQGDPENWYNQANIEGLAEGGPGWAGYTTAGSSGTPYDSAGGGGYSTSGSLGSNGYVFAQTTTTGGDFQKFQVLFGANSGNSVDEGFAFDDFGVTALGSLFQSVVLLDDQNSDGTADPGDTVRFTAEIDNGSALDFTNVDFTDSLSDLNLALIPGSVSTSQGAVISGNGGGDSTVGVDVGTSTGFSVVTISFDATVQAVDPTALYICAQGTSVSDDWNVISDDPNTVASADPACLEAFGPEVDSDNDGISDAQECQELPCPDTDGDSIPDFMDTDSDNDGISDADEGTEDPDGDGVNNSLDTDSDGDGSEDTSEGSNDSDNDEFANYADEDSDGDGVRDNIETQTTAGFVPASGNDTDGDGLDDAYDPDTAGFSLNVAAAVDTDGDGTADYLDTDSDGDGLSDLIEAHDLDGDGQPDTLPSGDDNNDNGLDDAFEAVVSPAQVSAAYRLAATACGDLTSLIAAMNSAVTELEGETDKVLKLRNSIAPECGDIASGGNYDKKVRAKAEELRAELLALIASLATEDSTACPAGNCTPAEMSATKGEIDAALGELAKLLRKQIRLSCIKEHTNKAKKLRTFIREQLQAGEAALNSYPNTVTVCN